MATLDVLDYQLGLDEALATGGPDGAPLLESGLRRQAVREARKTIDALAFRFALIDQRALPEDPDYLNALAAVKTPLSAATVLAKRRPIYARIRQRRRATTAIVLGALMLVVAAGAFFATSEEADTLTTLSHRTTPALDTVSLNQTFLVTPEMDRLHIDGTVFVQRDSTGVIEIRLLDPDGNIQFTDSFAARSGNYLRANLVDPKPGEWTLLVDFLSVDGTARVEVQGVRPTR